MMVPNDILIKALIIAAIVEHIDESDLDKQTYDRFMAYTSKLKEETTEKFERQDSNHVVNTALNFMEGM